MTYPRTSLEGRCHLKPCGAFKSLRHLFYGFPVGSAVRDPPTMQDACRRCGFDPWVGKIPWRRKWQPTPVFLPGKSHEQRSLAGYSPWSCRVTVE